MSGLVSFLSCSNHHERPSGAFFTEKRNTPSACPTILVFRGKKGLLLLCRPTLGCSRSIFLQKKVTGLFLGKLNVAAAV